MPKKLQKTIEKEDKLRRISDYVLSCINRVKDEIDLIASIKKNKRLFSKKYYIATLSLCDVYSRDIIITLNHILDEDTKTSSLFSLVQNISQVKKKKEFSTRLVLIKKKQNAIVQTRNNQVGHFNTKLNVFEKGYSHIHEMYMMMRPRDTKRILKELEEFYWDVKEELKINGWKMISKPQLKDVFKELIKTN